MKVFFSYLLGLFAGGGAGVLLASVLLIMSGSPSVSPEWITRWFCIGGSFLGVPLAAVRFLVEFRGGGSAGWMKYRKYVSGILTALAATVVIVVALYRSEQPPPPRPPAPGEQIVLDFEGTPKENIPEPWVVMKNPLAPGRPDFRFVERSEKVVCLQCVNSSFSLNREVDVDVVKFRRLNWEWRTERLPTGANVNPKGKDDKVLQILLYFDGGKVIKYMWDTTAPIGTEFDEEPPPRWLQNALKRVLGLTGYVTAIKEVVVESGSDRLGNWVGVSRDVYEDYKRIYGTEPPQVRAVRIQSNSQYTASTGSGCVGKLVFKKSEGEQRN